MPTVLVGVGAGIAAYKVAHLVRAFRKIGCEVIVAPTENSLQFIGEQTWQELSENPVARTLFGSKAGLGHIDLAHIADLIVVAPCTADLGAQIRSGSASSLLTAALLASSAPKLLVPAMHTQMWNNAATTENFEVLRSRGFTVMPPATGALSSQDSGTGRMPEPEEILEVALELLRSVHLPLPLQGKRIVITAGGTIEPIDPVRYLGNHSSGRQGIELAMVAARRGASVTLIAAQTQVPIPENVAGINVINTLSAMEMHKAVLAKLPETDILIMAAAVADYRPRQISEGKLKKETWGQTPIIELVRNPDILRNVANSSDRPAVLVGFAAETGTDEQVRAFGTHKALTKGADFLAVNRVGNGLGFGDVDNELWVLDGAGTQVGILRGDKTELSCQLLDLIVEDRR